MFISYLNICHLKNFIETRQQWCQTHIETTCSTIYLFQGTIFFCTLYWTLFFVSLRHRQHPVNQKLTTKHVRVKMKNRIKRFSMKIQKQKQNELREHICCLAMFCILLDGYNGPLPASSLIDVTPPQRGSHAAEYFPCRIDQHNNCNWKMFTQDKAD